VGREEGQEAIDRAKSLWQKRQKFVTLDRSDFRTSKNIASGNGISEFYIGKYGKDRAIVNAPILDPAVNAIAYRFDSNPFAFKIPDRFRDVADEQELTAALSKALREICWDGISYILVYHDGGKIKFRVLDNLNVVWGKCNLATGDDCREALCVEKINRQRIKKLYPDLHDYRLSLNSILSYSGPDSESGDEYEEVTYWEKTESGVRISKFIGGELAEESELPLTRLPIVRVCGKKAWTEGRENWRGIPYHARDMLATLTYMHSLLQERVATAPTFNFWVAQESAADHETARQMASMNGMPRAVAYYRSLENGMAIPPPIKVDKSAGIEELMAHIESLRNEINFIVGATGASPQAGTETAESVLLRRESKENATDEFLRNLLTGAQGIAALMEGFLAIFVSEKAKEIGTDAESYLATLGLRTINIEVTESIFEKAKQAADSQKLIAFASFLSQNPQSMDFAEALLETMDLSEDNKANMQSALDAIRQKERQSMEQLMQQGQQQAMQLQQAQAENQALQGQLAQQQKQMEAVQNANMVMQADSEAKIAIKDMELKNQLAVKQMEIEFKYAELAAKTGNDQQKNDIAAAKVANEQIDEIEAAMQIAAQHPTKGAFR
jgi:hypothetical protein